jgi:hypothetical protein
MLHGAADSLIPPEWSQSTLQRLQVLGLKPQYTLEKGLAHSVSRAQLAAVKDFLAKLLPAEQGKAAAEAGKKQAAAGAGADAAESKKPTEAAEKKQS